MLAGRALSLLAVFTALGLRSARIWRDKSLDEHAYKNADRVRDKVAPREDMSEDQMTQHVVPNTHQPRRLAELESFNSK